MGGVRGRLDARGGVVRRYPEPGLELHDRDAGGRLCCGEGVGEVEQRGTRPGEALGCGLPAVGVELLPGAERVARHPLPVGAYGGQVAARVLEAFCDRAQRRAGMGGDRRVAGDQLVDRPLEQQVGEGAHDPPTRLSISRPRPDAAKASVNS